MDYKNTLNLPKTDFAMKANLPQREPLFLKRWQEEDIYTQIQKKSKGKKKYVLHDGPPYANGDIHIGHALNKTLKDIVIKYKTMKGFDSPYVPGWDCHGLPVEHKLFKELKLTKYQIGQLEFRKKAYDYAMKYVSIQREQFKRLGVFGDWENPYLTLSKDYEADIVSCLAALVKKGYIYKGLKPINWCIKCETALAEAEVEYEDHTSPSVYVKFKVTEDSLLSRIPPHPCPLPQGERVKGEGDIVNGSCCLVIWTTTPWTLVANVDIAVHPGLEYAIIKIGTAVRPYFLVIAKDLVAQTMQAVGIKDYQIVNSMKGKELEGIECQHPFIDRVSKVVLAEYVSNLEGTGCVHTAPGHGQEDYQTGLKYKLPVIMPVDAAGKFDKTAGMFSGLNVFKANEKIIGHLKDTGALLASESVSHSYPHCWRCKEPVIVRATTQWFINVDHKDLRKKTLEIIKRAQWVPAIGLNRISAMVENRPDWCISRQRYWGVPIPAFYCKECHAELLDAEIIEHISGIFRKEGCDAWFKTPAEELLPKTARCKKCKSSKFDKEADIIDVWFDSGVSHQAVLARRKELGFPCNLYLEGSDQHRGWFQTALLTSVSIAGRAPFEQVLTHGFVVDGLGRKMSKSLGNVISPLDIIKKSGVDVLRLWVASCDYEDDIRISDEILVRIEDAYRKIRNTFKFMLGNLYDFNPQKDYKDYSELLEIDRWALNSLAAVMDKVNKSYDLFEFHKIYRVIYEYCTIELSSFYLDILKDRLYTFSANSIERKSAQTVLYEILRNLLEVLAPVLVFTCEEAWLCMPKRSDDPASVHLADWPVLKQNYQDEKLQARWSDLLAVINCVLKALEEKRAQGLIGNSLEAKVAIITKDDKFFGFLKGYLNQLSSIFIVSCVDVKKQDVLPECAGLVFDDPGICVIVEKAAGAKCQRCWNYSESVGKDPAHPEICDRCIKAIS